MVASQKIEILRELDLICKQQSDSLNTLLSAVDIVSDEQEFLVILRIPRDVEQPKQIEILTVHVTKYLDGGLQIQEHLLVLENFGAFIYEELERLLVQLDGLAPLAVLDFDELINDTIGHKLFFVICRWLSEVLSVLELFSHLVNLLLGKIVLLAVVSDGTTVLAILPATCTAPGCLPLCRRHLLVLHIL